MAKTSTQESYVEDFMRLIRKAPEMFSTLGDQHIHSINDQLRRESKNGPREVDHYIKSSCALMGFAVGYLLRSGDIYIGKVERDEEGA